MLCDVLVALGIAFVVTVAVNALQLDGLGRPHAAFDPAISNLIGAAAGILVSGALVVATGTSPGEAAVRLEGVDGRRPVWFWRVVRYLGGVGGYQLLLLVPVVGWLLALLFATVSVVVAWRSAGHRGLAGLVSGMRVRIGGRAEDAATSAPAAR